MNFQMHEQDLQFLIGNNVGIVLCLDKTTFLSLGQLALEHL